MEVIILGGLIFCAEYCLDCVSLRRRWVCTHILLVPTQIIIKAMNQDTIVRFSDDELGEFRHLIEDKIGKTQEEIASYRSQLEAMADSEELRIKGLDDGNGTVEAERLASMIADKSKFLKHLEQALVRIQNKTYGICRATGQLINKERLRVVPHATLSLEAKMSGKK